MNQTNEAGNLLPTMHDFNGAEVRTISINNEPYFVAKDVCDVLEIADIRRAVENLDEDEKLSGLILQSGQNREMWCVNESGLYHLIFKSRKPQAKAFRKWVTAEVLPAIRKTGSYSVGEMAGVPKELKGIGSEMVAIYNEYKIQPSYTISDLWWILRMKFGNVTIAGVYEWLHRIGALYDVSATFFNQPTPVVISKKIMESKNFPYQKGKYRTCRNLSIPVLTHYGLGVLVDIYSKEHQNQ